MRNLGFALLVTVATLVGCAHSAPAPLLSSEQLLTILSSAIEKQAATTVSITGSDGAPTVIPAGMSIVLNVPNPMFHVEKLLAEIMPGEKESTVNLVIKEFFGLAKVAVIPYFSLESQKSSDRVMERVIGHFASNGGSVSTVNNDYSVKDSNNPSSIVTSGDTQTVAVTGDLLDNGSSKRGNSEETFTSRDGDEVSEVVTTTETNTGSKNETLNPTDITLLPLVMPIPVPAPTP